MPKYYYDETGKICQPTEQNYYDEQGQLPIDYQYNIYIDTLMYYGYLLHNDIKPSNHLKNCLMNLKGALEIKLTSLERQAGFSVADTLCMTFDNNFTSGILKKYEAGVDPQSGDLVVFIDQMKESNQLQE